MKTSRRNFFGMGIGAAAAAGLAPMTLIKEAHASGSNSASHDAHDYQSSIEDAFTFQNTMMDAYATGDTVRLIQSYSDQSGLLSTAMTYDNAVSIHAYLLRRQEDDLARAEILGNGLIYAQANNFPIADGPNRANTSTPPCSLPTGSSPIPTTPRDSADIPSEPLSISSTSRSHPPTANPPSTTLTPTPSSPCSTSSRITAKPIRDPPGPVSPSMP